MNASFRTAFWAMCLGLTVPMVLFVGVELTSGGRPSRKSVLTAADAREAPDRSSRKVERARSSPQPPTDVGDLSNDGPRDSTDARVVLDPEIEPDAMLPEAEPDKDHRIPAFIARNQQRPESIPKPEPTGVAAVPAVAAAEIEARLAGIQRNLDELGREISRQGQREPPGDPLKQAAEILRQLRDARELERFAERTGPLSTPDQDDVRELAPDEQPPGIPEPTEQQPVPPAEADEPKKMPRPLTRIFRPRHIGAKALLALVEPLLTDGIGKAGAADAEPGEPGTGEADSAATDALVVHDYPDVLRKVDKLMKQVDVPPVKIVIEASIVTVGLPSGMAHGLDLRALNSSGQFIVSAIEAPATGTRPPPGVEARLLTHGYGLKCGILSGDPRAFLSALQSTAPLRRTSAWQMTVLNRQSAELMLSDPFGPTGSANSEPAGTLLRIRPIAGRDGSLRLDVRRELDLDAPASGGRAAALTNQFVLRDGQSAIVAGFLAEQFAARDCRTPVLGELPLVGRMFHKQIGVMEQVETIVLLTPHVVNGATAELAPAPAARNDRTQSSRAAGRSIRSVAARSAAERPPTIEPARAAAAATRQTAQTKSPQIVSPARDARPANDGAPRELIPGDATPIQLIIAAEEQPAGPKQVAESDVDSIPALVLPEEGPQIRPARPK